MDQMTLENHRNRSEQEPLLEIKNTAHQAVVLPSINLAEINRGKSEGVINSAKTPEAKALQWALNRLAGWELPGKEG